MKNRPNVERGTWVLFVRAQSIPSKNPLFIWRIVIPASATSFPTSRISASSMSRAKTTTAALSLPTCLRRLIAETSVGIMKLRSET